MFVACGLDIEGTASIDTTTGDGSPTLDGGSLPFDASHADGGQPSDSGAAPDADALPPPPPPIDASGCDAAAGCVVVPNGWTLVAIDTTQTAACPTGFTAGGPTNVVEGPNAPPSACGCATCSVTTPPSCENGAIGVTFDFGGPPSCNLPGQPSQMNNNPAGACGTDLYTMGIGGYNLRYKPPGPTGGACGPGAGVVQKQNVTYAGKARLCQPDNAAAAGCTGNDCRPILPAPYRACISGAGNQTCPAPYTVTHHVGTDVTYTCGGCACTLSATCQGSLTLYSDGNCQNGAHNVAVDDVCRPPGANGPFNSYKYAGSPTVVTCLDGPAAPPAGLALTSQLTICCAP